jgi:hypothetical protein
MRLSVIVIGRSISAPPRYESEVGRILTVILTPKDEPVAGRWWGVNAWAANKKHRSAYEED